MQVIKRLTLIWLTLFQLLFALAGSTYAASFASFELDGDEYYLSPSQNDIERVSDYYAWQTYEASADQTIGPNYQFTEIDTTTGAKGSKRSLKITVTGGDTNILAGYATPCAGSFAYNNKQEYLDNTSGVCEGGVSGGTWYMYFMDGTGANVPWAAGINRLSFWIKTSSDYNMRWHYDDPNDYPENYNMHFGIYTRDPAGEPYAPTDSKGRHFYHTMNVQTVGNSPYWTKIIIDNHPQQEVSQSADPGVNPTAWNYFDGFSRFYFKGKSMLPPGTPFSIWWDEFDTYVDTESDATTVGTVVISRLTDDTFTLTWSDSYDKAGGTQDTYEVRWSSYPITKANVGAATSLGTAQTGDWENVVFFKTGSIVPTSDAVYFAIRQTNANETLWYFASYELNGVDVGHKSMGTRSGTSSFQ